MSRSWMNLLLAAALLALPFACVRTDQTCYDVRKCPEPAASGGSAGGGAAGGEAGLAGAHASGAGGSQSVGGDAGSGEGGALAGEGGSGGVSPCGGSCVGTTAVCDESSGICVACLADKDCDGATPFCDTTKNQCVACLDNEDCGDSSASKCDGGQCVGCGEKADCAHIDGKPVCDTTSSACVECTGKDYSACGESEGTPIVCDSLSRTCSDKREHERGLCGACVSDANCKPGQMCVLEKYGEQNVGYFCFWKQGGGNGAPSDCATQGRPYVEPIESAVSIDGTTADICGLRISTCPANNEFGAKDCSTGGLPDDSKCSFDAPNDSKCVTFGATYLCTMRCGSSFDCPDDFACDTEASPRVCKL